MQKRDVKWKCGHTTDSSFPGTPDQADKEVRQIESSANVCPSCRPPHKRLFDLSGD